MKKSGIKKGKKKKTLKKLKEELNLSLEKKDHRKALFLANSMCKLYPKSIYGYQEVIKIKTESYTKCLEEKELNELKKTFDKLYEVVGKKKKKKLMIEFKEYVDDCKEVYNLKKIKKEVIEKAFLKEAYEEGINFVNKNIKLVNSCYASKNKVNSIYDLLKGLLLVACLIFNLINRNYLLIITVPFGIFGVITVYDFFDSIFLKKGTIKGKNENINELINSEYLKIEQYETEIEKLNEKISFLSEQKKVLMLKIPKSFMAQIEIFLEDDEEKTAKELINLLKLNKVDEFSENLQEKTNMVASEFINDMRGKVFGETDEISIFFKNKLDEKKKNKQKELKMKKITILDIIILVILCFISFSSLFIIIKNFYELNFISFVIALVVGIVSIIIYDVESGRHASLTDTFKDNLSSSVFGASLVYDLIYSWLINEVNFTYCFIEIPLIFLFIYIGIAMLVSALKYQYLYNKIKEA